LWNYDLCAQYPGVVGDELVRGPLSTTERESGGRDWTFPDLPAVIVLTIFARDSTDAASGYQSAQQPRAYPGVVGDGTGAAPIPH